MENRAARVSGSVAGLWRYPVKSMAAHRCEELRLAGEGVKGDRAWALLDEDSEQLVSAKAPSRYPGIQQMRALVTDDASGPPSIELPDGHVVSGDVAARRLSELWGRPVRFITRAPEGAGFDEEWPDIEGLGPDAFVEALTVDPAWREDARLIRFPAGLAAPPGSLVDYAPVHIVFQSALDALAEIEPERDWSPRRFRPNLLVTGDLVDDPGEVDDLLSGRTLTIGACRLEVSIPAPRCVMTTLGFGDDVPADKGVLRALASHRRRDVADLGRFACLGVYANVVQSGVVRTGDPVEVDGCEPARRGTPDHLEALRAQPN